MAAASNKSADLHAKYKAASQERTVGSLSKIDHYGFERADDFDYKTYEDFQSEYLSVLRRRTIKWEKVMRTSQKQKVKPDRKTKRFCRKGIPDSFRPKVWMDVSGASKKMERNPGRYQNLLSKPNQDAAFEATLQESIQTDLDRTFPDNIHFKDQPKKLNLQNVLIAYGRHNPSVCYCQGMNYVAALLLLVVKEEEKCFWLMIALLDEILPAYYTSTMASLRAEMGVLSDLVRKKYPAVHEKFDTTHTSWKLIASKWFICLYIDVLPTETVLRIWDCLFLEGSKILFRVALTIIQEKAEAIALCTSLYDIVELFKQVPSDKYVLECHQFLQKCFTEPNPLPISEINKLREQNLKFVEEEDEAYKKAKAALKS